MAEVSDDSNTPLDSGAPAPAPATAAAGGGGEEDDVNAAVAAAAATAAGIGDVEDDDEVSFDEIRNDWSAQPVQHGRRGFTVGDWIEVDDDGEWVSGFIQTIHNDTPLSSTAAPKYLYRVMFPNGRWEDFDLRKSTCRPCPPECHEWRKDPDKVTDVGAVVSVWFSDKGHRDGIVTDIVAGKGSQRQHVIFFYDRKEKVTLNLRDRKFYQLDVLPDDEIEHYLASIEAASAPAGNKAVKTEPGDSDGGVDDGDDNGGGPNEARRSSRLKDPPPGAAATSRNPARLKDPPPAAATTAVSRNDNLDRKKKARPVAPLKSSPPSSANASGCNDDSKIIKRIFRDELIVDNGLQNYDRVYRAVVNRIIVGMRVSVLFDVTQPGPANVKNTVFYDGEVKEIRRGTKENDYRKRFHIHYDDNDRLWTDFHYWTFKILSRRGKRSKKASGCQNHQSPAKRARRAESRLSPVSASEAVVLRRSDDGPGVVQFADMATAASVLSVFANVGIDRLSQWCQEQRTQEGYVWGYLGDGVGDKPPIASGDARAKLKPMSPGQLKAAPRAARPVQKLHLKTGAVEKTYESINRAARKCEVDKSRIGKVCRKEPGHHSAGGFRWRFADEADVAVREEEEDEEGEEEEEEAKETRATCAKSQGEKAVLQTRMKTGEMYVHDSITKAAGFIKRDASSISRCCNGHQSNFHGCKWRFVRDGAAHAAPKAGARGRPPKPVYQIGLKTREVIKTHDSVTSAAAAIGECPKEMSLCCNGRIDMLGGFVWRFAA